MSSVTRLLQENAKAVAGFVAGIILTAVQDVLAGNSPWPDSLGEWGKYLGTALVSGVLVWATGNRATEKQVVKGAQQQGISVITDTAIDVTRGAAERAVREAVSSSNVPLPESAKFMLDNIIHGVSQTVGNTMKGVAKNFNVDLRDIL